MKLIDAVMTVAVWYVVIDVMCFFMWALSGQFPPDSFFFGALTRSFIHLFI